MFVRTLIFSLLSSTVVPDLTVNSSDILAILPFPGRSHYVAFEPILIKLAEKGHRVTVYSNFPTSKPIPNFRNVDISPCLKQHVNSDQSVWRLDRSPHRSTFWFAVDIFEMIATVDEIIGCPPLTDLVNTTKKYDLLLTEFFTADWTLGYAQKFRIPFIGMVSLAMPLWISHTVALPEYPSYLRYGQVDFDRIGRKMNFMEKLYNVCNFFIIKLVRAYYTYTRTDVVTKSLFGADIQSVDEIAANTSLILASSHFTVNSVRPFVPAVVEVGGINIGKLTTLPEDVEKFINGSTNGVIYFSMGSVLRSSTFPPDKRNAFLNAFSRIQTRVIWKYETDDLPYKPDNVLISKWLPQRTVLAHPNVKLFISHCGQASINEAVNEAVPVLGIPIFNDQFHNILALISADAGDKLIYNELTVEIIVNKINQMLRDNRYEDNMKRLSDIFKDRPMSPLDTAVYWIEYVIRHKGAHHLRSPAVEMPWYRYFLIDVVILVLVFFILLICIIYFALKFISNLLITRNSVTKVKKN